MFGTGYLHWISNFLRVGMDGVLVCLDCITKFHRRKDLNKRHDVIKLLEESIDKTFLAINSSNISLYQSPKAKEIQTKINKWDLIKLKSFCTAKETINKNEKTTYRKGENICKQYDQQGLISKLYQQLIKLSNKQPTQSKMSKPK